MIKFLTIHRAAGDCGNIGIRVTDVCTLQRLVRVHGQQTLMPVRFHVKSKEISP